MPNNPLPAWEPLWPEGAPGALGATENDIPAIRYYPPTGRAPLPAAILVLPGGGYGMLAAHEGEGYARWFASLGYHTYELRYRLASHGYQHPSMWQDASRAMRLVRSEAKTAGFDEHKIGVIGSSAGGHLASHLSVKNDDGDPGASDPVEKFSSRPDAAILCYAVISMVEDFTHVGSRQNLLGDDAEDTRFPEVSSELHVSERTPPTFLWHTLEDNVVDARNSVAHAFAMRKAGVPAEVHLYPKGGHGIGLANGHPWTVACERWMREVFAL